MILVILSTFVIGFVTGNVAQVRRLGDDPVTIYQQNQLEILKCMKDAQTVMDEEECLDQ